MSLPFATPAEEIALRLRRACEAHEPAIGSHLDRVTHYACDLARRIGLPVAEIENLRHATPLHDLGKIALPVSLLDKPGRLTPEEIQLVRTHTVIGHQILEGSEWPLIRCAARIALSHHECWNGSGYPHGISGEAIPLDVRIVAIADVYDALKSVRAYKPAWDDRHVLAELNRLRGVQFDPAILDCFLADLPADQESATVAASEGSRPVA
jgi:response regulator RpfG family c-di-GMP phosphodiesterase